MQNDQSEKPSGTNPLVWVLVALVVLVLALGAGIIFMISSRPSSQPAPTIETTATSLPSATLPPPTETPVPPTASANGNQLAADSYTLLRGPGGCLGSPERSGYLRQRQ